MDIGIRLSPGITNEKADAIFLLGMIDKTATGEKEGI